MFVPDLHPAPARRQQRETFFGDGASHRVAVLTPIGALFNAMPGEQQSPESPGWWPSKVVGDTHIILTPQGSAVVDAIGALEPDVQIVFAGLAGALDTLSVGNVVEPTLAIGNDKQRFERTALRRIPSPDVTVATIACLSESMQRRDFLRQIADCVDMETAWVFAVAVRQQRHARAVLAISDHVYNSTFLETPLAAIRSAIDALAEHLCQTMSDDDTSRT